MSKEDHIITRIRFQFFGGLFLSIFFPYLLRFNINVDSIFITTNLYSITGATIGFCVGYLVMRQLSYFPGVRALGYVILSFSITYAFVVGFFFMFRVDYSRYLFGSSFALAIIWFSTLHFSLSHLIKTKLAIVVGGNAEALKNIENVEWHTLKKPEDYSTYMGGIVADLRQDFSTDWEQFLTDRVLDGVPVYHTKLLQEILTGRVSIEHLSENTLGSLLPNMAYVYVKSIIDWWLALLALPILFIFILVIGSLIKMTSAGPVFYIHKRIGYRGKEFSMIKFRTMVIPDKKRSRDETQENLPDDRTVCITADGDKRITGIGKFLRKTRIDELPQILNILKGDMSWIGPRPEACSLSTWYQHELPFYAYRHIIRPGISGWAQVNQGHVTNPDAVLEKLHYDFFYIKYFSPWLDFLILVKTIKIIFSGFGAK